MSYQNIASFCIPNTTLRLAANSYMYIDIAGYQGWTFDLVIDSTAASGTLKLYTQNSFPLNPDPLVYEPLFSLAVSGGTFPGGEQRYTFDNNNSTNEVYTVLRWEGTDSSSGNIFLTGIINIF